MVTIQHPRTITRSNLPTAPIALIDGRDAGADQPSVKSCVVG